MIRQYRGDGDPQNNPLPVVMSRAGIDGLPATIAAAGGRAAKRFVEFFTANIRNRNTALGSGLSIDYLANTPASFSSVCLSRCV